MVAQAEVRRRKPEPKHPELVPDSDYDSVADEAVPEYVPEPVLVPPKVRIELEDGYSPWLDLVRTITFLFVASCGLSYLISGGETWFWGMKHPPNYMQMEWWKAQWRGPLYLTPEQLAQFDGSDATKAIYLAINGTIYDVSSNRRTYGPGGSYHWFAGCDASRAYVTGCFAEDRTADMRGVEAMFLPLDDPEVDRHWTYDTLKELKEKELADARQRVHEGLLHWVNFFAKSKRYQRVGHVKKPNGWPGTEPVRPLCEQAKKQRKPRKVPEPEA